MAKGKNRKLKSPGHPPLASALSTPWAFLRPDDNLHGRIASSAKHLLDPLAASIEGQQSARRQFNRKRKRSEVDLELEYPHLQLKTLYVDGFTSNQIWEQATRILESAGNEVERDLARFATRTDYLPSADEEQQLDSSSVSEPEAPGSESDDADMLSDDASQDASGEEIDEELEGSLDHSPGEESDDMGVVDAEIDEDVDSTESHEEGPGTYMEDNFGLNDGFFSIDDFNRQSEMLERQDAKGGADDDEDSDEEVDWHADPLVAGNATSTTKSDAKRNARTLNADDMEDSSEDDGPTFGDADLQGDMESDEDVLDDSDADANDWVNTSDIKYADFFAPPARKASSKKARALPKTQPAEAITDDDVGRAMADVRRDLFDEESEAEDDDGLLDETGDPQTQRSTHEKQRARIADEIRRLEAANVAKKDWTLAGEARAVERPVNSLIEEDLDFERVGKPVPVVTNETTEDIEELVKRRILAKEFDEVVRRRPGASDTHAPRKSRFELEDTKPQQSLAELYETDHLRATDPNFVDSKDRKLMRERSEVTELWKEISSQLDTLSNWHYKPKAPQATINVVTDAPTIMMEEARPTAGGAAGGPSALAPQELYAPGDDGRVAGEVVLKSGAAISKDEMSREEKARARRHKKNQRKSDAEPSRQRGKAAEKQQLVSDLRKGGVKVINKDGQVTDMSGGKAGAAPKSSADALKL